MESAGRGVSAEPAYESYGFCGLSKSGGLTVIVLRPSESAFALALSPIAEVMRSTLTAGMLGALVGASGLAELASTGAATATPFAGRARSVPGPTFTGGSS